jgi:agmatine deiminase
VEAELKRVFGIQKVIWLKRGVADDDLSYEGKLPGDLFTVLTTGGHIDEFARFVGPRTILLAAVSPQEAAEDPIAKITHGRMEENFRILQAATDQDGRPFEIIRLPVPAPIVVTMDEQDEVYKLLQKLKFKDGTVIAKGSTIKTLLAASYLNFVVANGIVLVPSYWKEGRSEIVKQKDEAAQEVLRRVFPGRRIVPINPENINAGGGGMHCIVQQMPAAAPR